MARAASKPYIPYQPFDVVSVLADSADGRRYRNKLKQRLKEEGNEPVTNCQRLKMTAADGKKRLAER